MKIVRKYRSLNIISLAAILVSLISSALISSPAYAKPSDALQGQLGSNGQDARPFYNFAHNPNVIDVANASLLNGANALEPDVMHFPNPSCPWDPAVITNISP